jgi:hypothetical protein
MEPFASREEWNNCDKVVACTDEYIKIDLIIRNFSQAPNRVYEPLTLLTHTHLFSVRIANGSVVDPDIPAGKTTMVNATN